MKPPSGRRRQRLIFRRLVMIHMTQSLTLSLTGIIDSAAAGRFFGSEGLAAMKLAMPVYSVISLFGAWICSGMSIRIAQDLETGNREEANRTFRCGMTAALAVSAVMVIAGLLCSGSLARLFAGEIREAAVLRQVKQYVRVILCGAVFVIFSEHFKYTYHDGRAGQKHRPFIRCYLFYGHYRGHSRSQAQSGDPGHRPGQHLCLHLFPPGVSAPFRKGNAFFRIDGLGLDSDKIRPIILSGSPMAVRYVCEMLAPLLINRIMIHYGTMDGLAALSIQDAMHYLPHSFCAGTAATVLMLTGIYSAEQSREDLTFVRQFFVYYCIVIGALISFGLAYGSGTMLMVFTDDPELLALGQRAFIWYLSGLSFVGINLCIIAYFQAMGKHRTARIMNAVHILILPCIVTWIMTARYGMEGIYAAFAIHEYIFSVACFLSYLFMGKKNRRRSVNGASWDLTRFSVERHLRTIEEVIAMSNEVTDLCRQNGIEAKQALHTGLFCLEELGVNAIEHNVKVRHRVHLRVRFVIGEKWLILRLRDDGRPYDLTQAYSLINPEDPSSHIGLRLVYASADKVQYSSFLGLNNVCIRLAVKRAGEE
ncbi:MAG: ATP-binding protein [Lachnospiraceae bacterium]|nr:ATP-binding protein [Lachnospiraceae bacterium]